ncbi:hypothetical protein JCM10207_003739 [Rhodosporidiobolus poonsookiae]
MAYGFSTVFYGAFVRALHLLAAAKAWPSLKPTLLAIDLISLRRNAGTLVVEDGASTSITRTPPEIWSKIKLALVDVELEDAYTSISRDDLWCEDCREPPKAGPDGFALPCEVCSDIFYSEGSLSAVVQEHEKSLRSLLKRFNLYRPSSTFYNGRMAEHDDGDSLCAIAWPHRDAELLESNYEANAQGAVLGHAIHTFDPSALVVSPMAAIRFKAFSRLFCLPFYNPKTPRQQSKSPIPIWTDEVVQSPRWHFWSFIEDEY